MEFQWLDHVSITETAEIVSEYDQEIPQSKTADKPKALRGKAKQQPRVTIKTN